MAKQSNKTLAAQLVDAGVTNSEAPTDPVNVLTATDTTPSGLPSADTLTTPGGDLGTMDISEVMPTKTPIAQALLDQGKALATSAEATTNAHNVVKQQGESLAAKARDVIALTDTEAQHVIVQAMADLKTLALSTMGCPVQDATPEQLVHSAAHCLASFKVLSATLKRQNNGKHGLLYMALDRQTCDATVRVITTPTEAELRQALKDDTKALNAALESIQAKATQAKAMQEDSAQGEDGHVVIGSGVQSITAMAQVLELVKGWRPSELAVAAATLNHMALAGKFAMDPENASLKAEVDAARVSVTLLTSAYQTEKAAELLARNEAQAKAEADLLAVRTANALQRRADLEAEEKALAEANAKMAARMAVSPVEAAPTFTPTAASA